MQSHYVEKAEAGPPAKEAGDTLSVYMQTMLQVREIFKHYLF